MVEQIKSRDLMLPDLFKNLQLEWLTYKVRLAIYNREIERKIFRDVLKMKEDKINTFALKNSVPSIFSSTEKMERYIDLFYAKCGEMQNVADFQYTPKNKDTYLMFDRLFFYMKDSFITYNEMSCQIKYNDHVKCQLIIQLPNGENKKVPYCQVRKDISYIFNPINKI